MDRCGRTGHGSHAITTTATDTAGNVSAASGVTTVVVDTVAPTVTVNQALGQADPTLVSPLAFTGVFSEVVYGLTGSRVTLAGPPGPRR